MAVLPAIMIQSGLEMFGAIVLASATAFALRMALMHPDAEGDVQQSVGSQN